MMRRSLLSVARHVKPAAGAQQGLADLFATPAAAAAGGELAAPLLRRCSTAAARRCQQHALLPLAAAAAAAAAAAGREALPRGAAAAAALAAAGRRGYAQMGTKMPRAGYKPPAEMQRAMQMRLSMVSSNLLAEPYRGAPPPLPLKAYFTLAGWKEVWRRLLSRVKSMYAIGKCKKHIPGFDRKVFKQQALDIYKDVCRLLAAGDKTELRLLVTPAVWSDMKRQLKQREDGGWKRVQWDLVREPTIQECTTVHGRLIMIDPKDDSTGFAQLTMRIPSQQRFAAYDAAGRMVAGNPEKAIDVEDFWVFEHALKPSPANRWRLAGRLSVLPHAVEQKEAAGGSSGSGSVADAPEQQAAAAPAGEAEGEMRVGHIQAQQRPQQRRMAAAGARGRR